MANDDYQYTCMAGTVYSLFVYLLIMDVDQIRRTRFFLGDAAEWAIPLSSDAYLGSVMRIDNVALRSKSKFAKVIWRLRMWLVHLRKISGTKIYSQDQFGFMQPLICGAKYTLLEDGPGCYKSRMIAKKNRPWRNGFWRRLMVWMTWGRIQGGIFGYNRQCIDRIVTEPSDMNADILKGRKHTFYDRRELWRNSSDEKKQLILNVFGMSDDIVRKCQNADTIILTQPFYDDIADMTQDEIAEIYRPQIEKYRSNGVVLKVHSRDVVDYKKYFPDIVCLTTPVPMQLLIYLNLGFKRAVTAFSSAVSDFPKGTEIIVLGSGVHPKVEGTYGNIPPKRYFV